MSDPSLEVTSESAAQRSQRRAPRALLDIEDRTGNETLASTASVDCGVTFPQMIELLSDVSQVGRGLESSDRVKSDEAQRTDLCQR